MAGCLSSWVALLVVQGRQAKDLYSTDSSLRSESQCWRAAQIRQSAALRRFLKQILLLELIIDGLSQLDAAFCVDMHAVGGAGFDDF